MDFNIIIPELILFEKKKTIPQLIMEEANRIYANLPKPQGKLYYFDIKYEL